MSVAVMMPLALSAATNDSSSVKVANVAARACQHPHTPTKIIITHHHHYYHHHHHHHHHHHSAPCSRGSSGRWSYRSGSLLGRRKSRKRERRSSFFSSCDMAF